MQTRVIRIYWMKVCLCTQMFKKSSSHFWENRYWNIIIRLKCQHPIKVVFVHSCANRTNLSIIYYYYYILLKLSQFIYLTCDAQCNFGINEAQTSTNNVQMSESAPRRRLNNNRVLKTRHRNVMFNLSNKQKCKC